MRLIVCFGFELMIEQIPISEEPIQNITLLKEIITSSLTQGTVGFFIGGFGWK